MDPELVVQTLNFHGQQLTKLWENERGVASLQVVSSRDIDYQVYQNRSKDLGYVYNNSCCLYYIDDCWICVFRFQERGKRIRLHQFIVDKAHQLYKAEKKPKDTVCCGSKLQDEGNSFEFSFLIFLAVNLETRCTLEDEGHEIVRSFFN